MHFCQMYQSFSIESVFVNIILQQKLCSFSIFACHIILIWKMLKEIKILTSDLFLIKCVTCSVLYVYQVFVV